MLKKRNVSIPIMSRGAAVQPKTLNREKRTVEIVFTTGARVRRSSFWDGPFIEELGLKKSEVRMGRLQNGAPFLDNHGFSDKRGVRNVLGVIESAELIPEKKGTALVRFSKRAEVEDIFNDVEDGILRNVSVGYNTHEIKKVGEKDGIPIFRSTDWEPVEVSLVPAGADPKSQVRSDEYPDTDCVIVEEEIEETRSEETPGADKKTEPVAKQENLRENKKTGEIDMPTPEEIEQAKRDAEAVEKKARGEGSQAEKTRQKEIRSIVSKVKLDEKFATQWIDEDKSVDDVRTLAIDTLAEKDEKPETQTRSGNEIQTGEDLGRRGRIEGMTNALLHRFRPQDEDVEDNGQVVHLRGHKISEAGKPYAYLSMLDMARACLEAGNTRTGMYPRQRIAELAFKRSLHSTADFPEILANVVNKTLRNGYLAAPITWKAFTNEVFVDDFKEISRTNLGDAEKLEKLGEGSEVKRGTISEAAEKYQVDEYAKIVAITRKVIINDDLNFVTKLPERMGRRARDLESDLIWDIIKANANLSDSVALFAAGHGNLSTAPAAPTEAGLTEGRAAMRRQIGIDGAEIALTPVWMYVPPAHETAGEKLLAAIVPDSSTNVSPFSAAGRTPLRLDVEPRLETGVNGSLTSWFLMASKNQVDMIELARLTGSQGPATSTREGFDVHGMEIKIMHDVGAKAIDHRGLFKNAGA